MTYIIERSARQQSNGHLLTIRGCVYAIRKVTSDKDNISPGAIVETDIAKTKSGPELEDVVELVDVSEVETVFSRRHDVVEADGGKRKQ